jgi:V8-like Glu-specific endopeptidase
MLVVCGISRSAASAFLHRRCGGASSEQGAHLQKLADHPTVDPPSGGSPAIEACRISFEANQELSFMATSLYEGTRPQEAAETEFETVEEVGGEAEAGVDEATSDAHTPISYSVPITTADQRQPSSKSADEGGDGDEGFQFSSPLVSFGWEAGDESTYGAETQFESVEGWDETVLNEAASEESAAEATIDAWYAEATPQDQQEFFGALLPLLLPLAKAAIPAIAGQVVSRLGQRIRPRVRGRESYAEASEEADIEAALQQMEVIIGTDDRVQVKNTTAVPWKRIVHLQIEAANGSRFLGSGALIGPRTVVTAGHCVYLHTAGGWPRSITVSPGRNGASRPFGQARAIGFRTVKGWKDDRKRDYDYGAIILPPNAIKMNPPSAFGFASLSDAALKGSKLNTAGYPGDKPAGTMWYHGRNATSVTPRTIVYDIDTMGGQSGSPVWTVQNGKRVLAAIHTNGSPRGNSATRITQPVLENLKRWKRETN